MLTVDQAVAVMMTLPQYVGDVIVDPPAERAKLYRPVAAAIVAVAKNDTEVATLISLAHHETALARYVLDGHCEQGPVGAQCDGGRARGPWQVWAWCKGAWEAKDGSPEEKLEGAKCAIRLLRTSRTDCARVCKATGSGCKPLHAAFSGYAGRGCDWPHAARRVSTTSLLQGRIKAERSRVPDGSGAVVLGHSWVVIRSRWGF